MILSISIYLDSMIYLNHRVTRFSKIGAKRREIIIHLSCRWYSVIPARQTYQIKRTLLQLERAAVDLMQTHYKSIIYPLHNQAVQNRTYIWYIYPIRPNFAGILIWHTAQFNRFCRDFRQTLQPKSRFFAGIEMWHKGGLSGALVKRVDCDAWPWTTSLCQPPPLPLFQPCPTTTFAMFWDRLQMGPAQTCAWCGQISNGRANEQTNK